MSQLYEKAHHPTDLFSPSPHLGAASSHSFYRGLIKCFGIWGYLPLLCISGRKAGKGLYIYDKNVKERIENTEALAILERHKIEPKTQ